MTRATARRRPREFYRKAAGLAVQFPLAPHCFERRWDHVFCCNGTVGRLADGQTTAYFKPIRRLAANPPLVPGTDSR